MNEMWPALIQSTIEPPKTIAETVDRLVTVLDDEHKTVIAAMPEEDLFNLYFSLGLVLRNAFCFWGSKSPLQSLCNASSPDDISDKIIHALWQQLTHKSNYAEAKSLVS